MDKAELLKQKKIWYAKLEKSGFKDIENTERTDNQYLKPNPFQNTLDKDTYRDRFGDSYYEQKKLFFYEKENYYRLAGQFLYSHKFESKVEEFIWEKHATGLTQRQISTLVKKRYKAQKHSLMYINEIINKLAKTMIGRDDE